MRADGGGRRSGLWRDVPRLKRLCGLDGFLCDQWKPREDKDSFDLWCVSRRPICTTQGQKLVKSLRAKLYGVGEIFTLSCLHHFGVLQVIPGSGSRSLFYIQSHHRHLFILYTCAYLHTFTPYLVVQILYIQSGEVCHHIRRLANRFVNQKRTITHAKMGYSKT